MVLLQLWKSRSWQILSSTPSAILARVLPPSTYGMRRRKRRSATGIGRSWQLRRRKGWEKVFPFPEKHWYDTIWYTRHIIIRVDDIISQRSPHLFISFLGRMQNVYVFFQELRQLAENGGALEWEAPVLELVTSHVAGATWGLQTCVRIDKLRYVSIYPWLHPLTTRAK